MRVTQDLVLYLNICQKGVRELMQKTSWKPNNWCTTSKQCLHCLWYLSSSCVNLYSNIYILYIAIYKNIVSPNIKILLKYVQYFTNEPSIKMKARGMKYYWTFRVIWPIKSQTSNGNLTKALCFLCLTNKDVFSLLDLLNLLTTLRSRKHTTVLKVGTFPGQSSVNG